MASPSTVIALVGNIRIGRVRLHRWGGRDIASGAVKDEAPGPVRFGPDGPDGDEQADLRHHGGPDKAVLAYAGHHYRSWGERYGLDLPEGAFFENLSLVPPSTNHEHREPSRASSLSSSLPLVDENSVRIADIWQVGSATLQVSQPRRPCFKLARRWAIPDLVQRVQTTGWSGWYLRVVTPGTITPGDQVHLLDTDARQPTVALVSRVLNDPNDLTGARELVEYAALPERWRLDLQKRMAGRPADEDAEKARIFGPTD
ncbi:MOSC domain-containing protein [Austwickia chelonae]|uniref:MOSC domain-containing protein n=1 Tax=Austwickia chelonae TaxID=100225 RepID=UPI0013C37BD2|nr:MOSC domain-containing protein [Austwickia chelonae]